VLYTPGVDDDATVHRGTRDALIVDGLAAIFDHLAGLEDSPQVRTFRAQARSYEKATQRWSTVRPSDAQIAAMLELVSELLVEVTTSSPQGPSSRAPSRSRR
jgi:hypothetical protein